MRSAILRWSVTGLSSKRLISPAEHCGPSLVPHAEERQAKLRADLTPDREAEVLTAEHAAIPRV
jgi:hypothetical protein